MEGNKAFLDFRKNTAAKHSDILDAWCVDTCQMWYSGLGLAFEQGAPEDVYWLIPGDFNYGTAVGKDVLGRLHDLPEGRESLASAMQQVERTERVLKTLWRERNQPKAGWTEQYRLLETQSEQVRRTALIILQNLLG